MSLAVGCLAGQGSTGLEVLGLGVLHDLIGQGRGGWGLVPLILVDQFLEVVPLVLLVAAGLVSARLVLVGGLEAGAVGREHLVDEDGADLGVDLAGGVQR